MGELTEKIKKEARHLGFLAVGVAPPSALEERRSQLTNWIQSGFAGKLHYMENFLQRQQALLSRIPDLRSILVLAVSYAKASRETNSPSWGKVARYARGKDYHRVIEKRLKKLEAFIQAQVPDSDSVRTVRCVDTGALQERVLAEMAGIGFFGKNTCLILPKGGSFVFLAALLTNLPLEPDEPISWDCGDCSLCLQACPTQALVKPYELDARRCISYLTIELKGSIDPELRPSVHNWLFGCDICQEVCPYNKRAAPATWEEFQPKGDRNGELPLEELLQIKTEEAFLDRFAGTPLMRAKRTGIVRNAAVVAGNSRNTQLIPALQKTLAKDPSPLVQEHAAWALEKITDGRPLKEKV